MEEVTKRMLDVVKNFDAVDPNKVGGCVCPDLTAVGDGALPLHQRPEAGLVEHGGDDYGD